VSSRVVEDRNAAGGVTAGIDFGPTLAAWLRCEELAKRVQLVLEYDPKPPFAAGSPEASGPELAAQVLKARAGARRSQAGGRSCSAIETLERSAVCHAVGPVLAAKATSSRATFA
jgi:hypothetical protein